MARQLLAISEQRELVRFEIYPASAPDGIREQLMEFSQDVAAALGIEVYRRDDGDEDQACEIALVVANEWWDDGAA